MRQVQAGISSESCSIHMGADGGTKRHSIFTLMKSFSVEEQIPVNSLGCAVGILATYQYTVAHSLRILLDAMRE
jgi:hypothetical protein